MERYAQVIIGFAKVPEIDKFFTYSVPPHLQEALTVGMRVKVPFGAGNKYQIGYVMGLTDVKPESKYRIKAILDQVDEPRCLSDEQLAIVRYLVGAYGTTYAMAIDTILPPGLTEAPLVEHQEKQVFYELAASTEQVQSYKVQCIGKKSLEKQLQLIERLEKEVRIAHNRMKNELDMSMSSLQTLCKKGIVIKTEEVCAFRPDAIHEEAFKVLTNEQQQAYHTIEQSIESSKGEGILLQGVTGSGKTEVFLYAIKKVLERGETAIVLVPEIALTPQTVARFKERFGNRVALTHSRMTPKQRQQLFIKVKKGEVGVVIGPRSAVFMPMPNLSLIVIDEEHETTYKSETMPKYHATDVAKMRMEQTGGTLLLASATPSFESYEKAIGGTYKLIQLKNRATGATLPEVHLVDMRQELKNGNMQVVSMALHDAIAQTLEEGHQVMLLINRRGHSTFINCRNCGYVVKCKHCDIAMTYHMQTGKLECHHCGSYQEVPTSCPSCESKHIRFFGNGTEKVEAYLNTYFGEYGIGRMDFDTTSGKEGHSKVLEAFKERRFNVLVGTQMIAKGHDFPNVALVGILSADTSLYMQDFRSEERTFQLLTQALGRAGRGDIPGTV
ncbi:MAG: replication restart helicase PriA, partial [Cellulosilyticaceae bacterium]